jgi:hypothetical protein
MGLMKVMGPEGDTEIAWDPDDKASVEKAKEEFNRLKKDGYEFFEVAETKGKQVKRFSKKAGKLIAAPRAAKSQAEKTGGRAMAGGPLSSLAR